MDVPDRQLYKYITGNVVINTDCEGVCYRIYTQQKFQIMPERLRREGIIKEFLLGAYPVTNARACDIYYYYKDWLAYPVERNIPLFYFYEATQTREPPYCFECMVALVKVDEFTNEKFKTTLPFFSGPLLEVLLPADSMRTDGFSFTVHFRSL